MSDNVNNPKHYTSHPSGIECIEVTRHMSFNLGNVVKYLWRADLKGTDIQDLEKAAWYLADEITKRKAAADGWTEWEGCSEPDECPAEDQESVVEYRMRYGGRSKGKVGALRWDHRNADNDIIAYRVVKEKECTT